MPSSRCEQHQNASQSTQFSSLDDRATAGLALVSAELQSGNMEAAKVLRREHRRDADHNEGSTNDRVRKRTKRFQRCTMIITDGGVCQVPTNTTVSARQANKQQNNHAGGSKRPRVRFASDSHGTWTGHLQGNEQTQTIDTVYIIYIIYIIYTYVYSHTLNALKGVYDNRHSIYHIYYIYYIYVCL